MSEQPRQDAALLLRRAGFTGTATEIDAAVARGYDATVDLLVAPAAPDPGVAATPPPTLRVVGRGGPAGSPERAAAGKDRAAQTRQLTTWWIARMTAAQAPLVEKLAWFWHTHFATSVAKVREPALMLRQNELFRAHGLDPFAGFTLAVAQDPAMLVWLDAGKDKAGHPNENFARELMELFTLGIGHYSETDVREAARAFTGWSYDRANDAFVVHARQHDAGAKTVLGSTGPLTGEDVVRLIVHREDSARWVLSRLWSRFGYPVTAADPVVDDLLPGYSPDAGLAPVLRAMFRHPAFRGRTAVEGLVKQPVEYVVSALRLLGVPAGGADVALAGTLRSLGQLPFAPPSVGGWPANRGWLSSASSLARASFAASVVRRADLSPVADAPVAARVDAVAHQLGVASWTTGTAAVLRASAADPGRLVTLALLAPEFVVN